MLYTQLIKLTQQIITNKFHMFSKEQVRNHRNHLRTRLKSQIIHAIVEIQLSPGIRSGGASPLTKVPTKEEFMRQRRITEDLSVFENSCRNKDIYINSHFQDLFLISQKLGEGAQSYVKKCTEKATSLDFAVKFFRRTDLELTNTLKMQFKILKILSHPNIIQARNLFIDKKRHEAQLVLQFYPHPELKDYINNNGRLEQEEVSDIIGQLLLAVSYMHDKGVCHRDIKPQNILYDPAEREVKLIDFEISKMNRRHGKMEMWTMTGTVYYKAPEMFAGKYCEAIDVWSIGVTAYEMLTGRLPFMKEYLNDTIEDIKHREPIFPHHVSKFARDFIRRCLTKDPLKRITAKQALSCPFILQCDNGSVLSSPSPDKLNQSFQSKGKAWIFDAQNELHLEINKCFQDEDLNKSFELLDSHDIGIRCCEDEEELLYG